jgi:Rieske Fe-S protein
VLAGNNEPSTTPSAHGVLEPNAGAWRAVGASVDLPDGGALAFDLGSVSGFVHRADTRLEAVSGVCTHQGCKLWLDAPDQALWLGGVSPTSSIAPTTPSH